MSGQQEGAGLTDKDHWIYSFGDKIFPWNYSVLENIVYIPLHMRGFVHSTDFA